MTRTFSIDVPTPDQTAPKTTAAQSPQANASGWVTANTGATVTLSADDGTGSGVAATYYTIDGQAQQQYAAPFTVSGQGRHTVVYWSTDVAGNAETHHTMNVNIDSQAPVALSDADGYWHNSDVTVTLSGMDPGAAAGSGVAGVAYRPASSDPNAAYTSAQGDSAQLVVRAPADGSNDGTHAYQYFVTDGAGNVSAVHTVTVRIDTRMPNTILSGLPTGWTDKPVALTYTTTPGTGAPITSTQYSLDGGTTWMPWVEAASLTISTPGSTTLLYRSTSETGTVETARSSVVNIDTTKPVCSAAKNVSVSRNRTARLAFTVGDAAPSSGSASVTITILRGRTVVKRHTMTGVATNTPVTYLYKAALPHGSYTWKVAATDAAGNVQKTVSSRKLTVR